MQVGRFAGLRFESNLHNWKINILGYKFHYIIVDIYIVMVYFCY